MASHYVIVSFIAILFACSATCLMEPDRAKFIANEMRNFGGQHVYQYLYGQGEQLKKIIDELPTEQAALAKDQIEHLIEALLIVKKQFNELIYFNIDYRLADDKQAFESRFVSITSNFSDVIESTKLVDENLYGEPSLFDLLAQNKNSTTNCTTQESSIDLINVLYASIIDYEIEKLAESLYVIDVEPDIDTSIEMDSEEKLKSEFLKRVEKLHKAASDAIDSANEEIKKCV